ncbi:MAG: CDP-alcohol phosphatidyltransferase family protein [Candidatus Gracilibacteria bacterium]|nr:CDP-alcohol phosphatidyltransferase family protein [Candidatus Gracilibacteria bacterium]
MWKTYYHSFLWYLASKNITPNDVTVARTIAFLLVVILWMIFRLYAENWTLLILIIVSVPIWLLDMVDGDLARTTNQMTERGKRWDPAADKVKFYAIMIVMGIMDLGIIVLGLTALMGTLDFLSTYLREFQKTGDKGANIFGKAKLVFQVFTIIGFALYIYLWEYDFGQFNDWIYRVALWSLIAAILLATISVIKRLTTK